jgi:quinol-cytochrome oxidoreductase complex cytochrome b subunit
MPADFGFVQRIYHSIFPGVLKTPGGRENYRRFLRSLILHFRPRTVHERTLRFTLTWGLGGMGVVLVGLLFGTGLMLKFFYHPSPDKAYESILYLQNNIIFGQLIRNIHHWSANLLVIVLFLHMLRVFFTGAFQAPRQFNWIIGLVLLAAVLLSNFTGYLLPWDQLAFWAVTISAGMLEYIPAVGTWLQRLVQGGPEVGPGTLSNFYAIHTAVLPAALIILLPFHFWRVRKAGGLVIPRAPDENASPESERVESIQNLLLREVVVALVLIALILVFAAFVNAPLGGKANPGLSPNPTKAPWYFVGIQEVLMHFHPLFALFIIPVLMVLALSSIPYLTYSTDSGGIWFVSSKGRRMSVVAALIALIGTPLGILMDEYLIDTNKWLPSVPPVIAAGLIPFAVIVVGIVSFYVWIRRRYEASKLETVQALFVLLLTAFLIFTLTGIFFRGEGMRLTGPLAG